MVEKLSKTYGQWMKGLTFSEKVAHWVEGIIRSNLDLIKQIESSSPPDLSEMKKLRKIITENIEIKGIELDDLSMNPTSSYKLQISVPANINYLMKAWALAEGRDLSSVALQCLEIGLRQIKCNGGIPKSATERYETICEKMLLASEIKALWERSENNIKTKNI